MIKPMVFFMLLTPSYHNIIANNGSVLCLINTSHMNVFFNSGILAHDGANNLSSCLNMSSRKKHRIHDTGTRFNDGIG